MPLALILFVPPSPAMPAGLSRGVQRGFPDYTASSHGRDEHAWEAALLVQGVGQEPKRLRVLRLCDAHRVEPGAVLPVPPPSGGDMRNMQHSSKRAHAA